MSRKNIYPGVFITFEGPEGAGKSTQIRRLADRLSAAGKKCVLTREPGGTPLAEKLRDIVKHYQDETVTPASELLLMAAARSQHVAHVILPALQRGDIVLCDRFADSTAAYQGAGRNMDMALIKDLRQNTVAGCEPDLTIVMDLPVEAGFARAGKRAETAGKYDRFESQELDFHCKVRQYFLDLAQNEPERVKVVDASADADTVSRSIQEITDELF